MAETAPTSFYFLPKHPFPGRENREQESISQEVRDAEPDGAFSWLTSWFGGRRGYRSIESKMRKVPTKVEPKVCQEAKLHLLSFLSNNHLTSNPFPSNPFPRFFSRTNVHS